MNVSSHYKKHINSTANSKKKTMHIKDITEHTPIPTAIKLKTPEPIQSDDDCSIFDYPIHDIVNTNFTHISSTYNKLAICPYFITTCKNRYGVYKPYLQYLLYKYPVTNKKFGNFTSIPIH